MFMYVRAERIRLFMIPHQIPVDQPEHGKRSVFVEPGVIVLILVANGKWTARAAYVHPQMRFLLRSTYRPCLLKWTDALNAMQPRWAL